jgi:hypothetical protein
LIIPEVKGQHTEEVARPERQGISTRKVIEEAKRKVSTLDLADLLCEPGKLHRVGDGKRAACCPLPGHDDKTPSFVVYTSTNSWFCFACLVGGDVIELARHAWGYDKAEVATASAMLLMEFGHQVPQRPPSWFARQDRQAPVRKALQDIRVRSTQRRLFRKWAPYIAKIEDDAERHREEANIWDELLPVARMIVARGRV